jgi:hypothetical protein
MLAIDSATHRARQICLRPDRLTRHRINRRLSLPGKPRRVSPGALLVNRSPSLIRAHRPCRSFHPTMCFRPIVRIPSTTALETGLLFPPVPPNEVPSAKRHGSFDDRFGNWTASPEGGITPRDSPPPLPGGPLGIFTGRPMPSWITPPPLGGLLNNSNASSDSDGFNLLAGLVSRNPPPPAPPQQTAGSIPERRLVRKILNQSPAPAYDPGAAAAPLAPSVDANYSGGLLGMYAALPGTDPRDPNEPAPPDDAQEQANLQALEDRLTSTGNINDAWALYKARKARWG